ncbi:NAD-dependent succinate-semialdehyde dehydrogenase [Flavobacterium cucumis]|uniref:Succinate-semialdehyde dehydrogenase / glutarate-semialdehyde dehydrogenase n=1 Tax=Flavobacterium cucumis TaxID=416016 RepID=A0A1M7ZU12_9FLAO|nr:NAD-dependent succinate-semialdehyde dehydrogenase [Flavobacterium cucumis]SHO72293.1 succinate-semialdehyde dehydrogenase / glutarate-semialdehyde dehydrogenase [Flavobacterium cucumis]
MQHLLKVSENTQLSWCNFSIQNRISFLLQLAKLLLENKEKYAICITTEMHKPISQAIAEVEKCALLCNYYSENAETFLATRNIKTEASESFVTYEPLGVILGVMPWNFPFWQVFRFAVPTLIAGNTVVVKHASNVPKSAKLIQEIFEQAGFPKGCYQDLRISSDEVAKVIGNPIVKAVSLTGSEQAGIAVATEAGKHLKKCVLELGGSNAFIILEDANVEKAVATAVNARMQNAGQSCIAAKRFLVHKNIADEFVAKFKVALKNLKTGNPLDKETQIGSLARVDLAEELEVQVQKSIEMGAKLIAGGNRKDAFYEPTTLTKVTTEMPVFNEETFGPVAAIITFKTIEEAIKLSNQSEFGLGVSIFTQNIDFIKTKISAFNEGAVFINEMVKSDPRLPFGGIKKSGYGRELAEDGIKEFVNVKTVVINIF